MSIVGNTWNLLCTNPLTAFGSHHASRTAPAPVPEADLEQSCLTGPDWSGQSALLSSVVERRDAYRSEAASRMGETRGGAALALQSLLVIGGLNAAMLCGLGHVHMDVAANIALSLTAWTSGAGFVIGTAKTLIGAVKGDSLRSTANTENDKLERFSPGLAVADANRLIYDTDFISRYA